MRYCAAALILLIAGSCQAEEVKPWTLGDHESKSTKTSDHERVRQWLAENTDSGKWNEVKWWGPIQPYKGGKGRYLRLKYRTVNRFGGTSLVDSVFWLSDTEIETRGESNEMFVFRRYYFEGVKSEEQKGSEGLAGLALDIRDGKYNKKSPVKPKKPRRR